MGEYQGLLCSHDSKSLEWSLSTEGRLLCRTLACGCPVEGNLFAEKHTGKITTGLFVCKSSLLSCWEIEDLVTWERVLGGAR